MTTEEYKSICKLADKYGVTIHFDKQNKETGFYSKSKIKLDLFRKEYLKLKSGIRFNESIY